MQKYSTLKFVLFLILSFLIFICMTQNPQSMLQKQETPHFQNRLLTLTIEINNPNQIYKDSQQITGQVKLIPKFIIFNLPIHLTILGESLCILYDQNQQIQKHSQNKKKKQSNSFQFHQTEQDIIEKRNQIQNCLQSTEYLSQNFNQNTFTQQKNNKQIFLEGKQTLYQTSTQEKKSIKLLQSQKQYFYQFTFFLPNNLPSSINQQIFNGVHLLVNFKIQVMVEIDEKFIIFPDQNSKKQTLSQFQSTVLIEKGFLIQRRTKVSHQQSLCNKLIFKYFHKDGRQVDNEFIEQISCLKYFYEKITKRSLKYDVYHCQILTTINQFKILHITTRIFIQPNKDNLDKRMVKKGKFYSSNQQSNQSQKQNKNKNEKQSKEESKSRRDQKLTISKIVDKESGRQKQLRVKIKNIFITMYGQIIGVKKIKIFEKVITFNREMYDICEGQLITEIPFEYFSEKNQLFQIKYWFQIQPLSDIQAAIKLEYTSQRQKSMNKNEIVSEFQLTMSQLNEQRPGRDKNQKSDKTKERIKKNKTMISKVSREIQKIEEVINLIQL